MITKNNGAAAAAGSKSDLGSLGRSWQVPGLAPGDAFTYFCTGCGLPISTEYTARADIDNAVSESDETNNSRQVTGVVHTVPTCTTTATRAPTLSVTSTHTPTRTTTLSSTATRTPTRTRTATGYPHTRRLGYGSHESGWRS